MCGITGIWYRKGHDIELPILARMAHAIKHRGPDDEGFFIEGSLGLAHRRLSILDLSAHGHQPLSSTDGMHWIVFNGEIYNYIELRKELQSYGYRFHTETDTEVILAAYRHWGKDCVQYFNGMWAFALWDRQAQALFCSRDRLGVKPFFYVWQEDCFLFASEPKALLQHPATPRSVNAESLYLFMHSAFSHIDDKTFFKGIQQLEPGYSMWVTQEKQTLLPYWSLKQTEVNTFQSEQELTIRFKELFTDSVRLRLRSDVPIGSCLSGGLDSSAIVCTAHQLLHQEQHPLYQQQTFSVCYPQPELNEKEYMDAVLEATQAQSAFTFPTADDFLSDYEQLVYMQDEPFPYLSMFTQWCVMKLAGQTNVKVLLDGQGSDEMLAGYGYNSVYWAELAERHNWMRLGQEWYAQQNFSPLSVLRGLPRTLAPDYLRQREINQRRPSFLTPEFQVQQHEGLRSRLSYQPVFKERMRNEAYYLMNYSLRPLLRYEDRSSMAFSLETRLPFLDYRLVEFIFSLPSEMLIRNGWSKWILRHGFQDILPEKVRWRKNKMGFPTPQGTWLKKELRPLIESIFTDARFSQRPWWSAAMIQRNYADFVAGKNEGFERLIWPIACTELWMRRFIDHSSFEDVPLPPADKVVTI